MTYISTNSIRYIDTDTDFENIVAELLSASVVAVDLEADSMFHFKEKVCLIQMATSKKTFIIDPLNVNGISRLAPLFSDQKIIKIFHGADYDVRCLYRDFNITINNLFDTQIACRFLNYPKTSLDAALDRMLDISIDKKFQKKDWSRRPLPIEMIEYAANDVKYLIRLHDTLKERLEKINRLQWVLEECLEQSDVRPAESNDQPLFIKFKGAGKLDPNSLAVLEALLLFRMNAAEKKDRPPFKIMGSQSLLALAKLKPVNKKQLQHLNVLSKKQLDMYGNSLVKTIIEATRIPKDELPSYPRKSAPRVSANVSIRIKKLQQWRDKKADNVDMDPSTLFPKASLKAIALANPFNAEQLNAIPELKHWQKKEFGKDIVRILAQQT